MNTFEGQHVRLTTFGESHGPAIGGVLDGFPSGFHVDFDFIHRRMEERRPGRPGVSARREPDEVEVLSGLTSEGVTLGTPIGFMIRNADARSGDYDALADAWRPGHADYAYEARYGIRDHRGGGRASARETACRVFAGALCEQYLLGRGVRIEAWLSSVGGVEGEMPVLMGEIEKARRDGDSVGGVVTCVVSGMSAGVGDPVYGKLTARLAAAMMSINASKGFEIGDGFELARKRGSEVIDEYYKSSDGRVLTHTNHSGGLQGGITTGMPIVMRVAFKPTPTIGKPVPVYRPAEGRCERITVAGRHDPCVALRAVPVVRAMAALTLV